MLHHTGEHHTGEHWLRHLEWHIHPLQTFQVVGPITFLHRHRLLSSLEHMTVLQPRGMHTLWIKSQLQAGNSHHI